MIKGTLNLKRVVNVK
jgi:1-phosphatidylinositol-4-phosphate 5-kinase